LQTIIVSVKHYRFSPPRSLINIALLNLVKKTLGKHLFRGLRFLTIYTLNLVEGWRVLLSGHLRCVRHLL